MLSYQHIYHAGNLADTHKHAILTEILSYLIYEKTPVSYYETHAGRGLYDLNSTEAQKTSEFIYGIKKIMENKNFYHLEKYMNIIQTIKKQFGQSFYPGSPFIAKKLLRKTDLIYLMELHPGEIVHLRRNIKNAHIFHKNGYEEILSIIPPYYKKGLILLDPSYEIKTEYQDIPKFITKIYNKWSEAIIMLWYPILKANNHQKMIEDISDLKFNFFYNTNFLFSKNEHIRMLGTGVVVINCPKNLETKLNYVNETFKNFTNL